MESIGQHTIRAHRVCLDPIDDAGQTRYTQRVSDADHAARRARAAQRRAAMTITLAATDAPEALGPFGLEAMVLACQLTRAAYAVAGVHHRAAPRSAMAVSLRTRVP